MTLAGRPTRKKRTPPLSARHRREKAPLPQAKRPKPAPPQAKTLLAWYDQNRRRLPWRAEPGERADPYRVLLSEIMLQQTTVKAVAPYYARFLDRFPTLHDLAAAKLEDVLILWAGLGYYSRARHLYACARTIVAEYHGQVPDREDRLRALPGIGAYTAAAIAAIAFDRKATPVDGNVIRVTARLFAVEEALPEAKAKIAALAATLTPDSRAGDFAQAMMDLGATICTPKNPACALCPWRASCAARARGEPESFPRKRAKANGKLRRGAAFVVLRADGAVLLRTRPARGLLAAMSEVPTSEWRHDFDDQRALDAAPRLSSRALRWRKLCIPVTHTFTHFPLELAVHVAHVSNGARAPNGMRFVLADKLGEEALPSIMRKVIAKAKEDST
jgi:A/G-specific adenine glycosylase